MPQLTQDMLDAVKTAAKDLDAVRKSLRTAEVHGLAEEVGAALDAARSVQKRMEKDMERIRRRPVTPRAREEVEDDRDEDE